MERQVQWATILVGLVAATFAMIATRDISAPIILALAVGIVLSPISDFWARLGLSTAMGAIVSLVLTLVLLGGLVVVFQPVFMQLIATAPKVWADMQEALQALRDLARGLSDLSKDVSGSLAEGAAAEPAALDSGGVMPSVTDALWLAPAIAGQVLTFVGTLFFFMLSRDEIYDWTARRLSEPSNRAVTAQRLRNAERSVARYFLTVSTVNAGLGIATGIGLQAIGTPAAAMWGLLAFLLNFVPYLGPGVLVVGLLFAGIGAFDGLMVVAPVAVFVMMNFIEGQFVTPSLVGRNLELNPLLVFLTLVFGIWVWGAIGGVVAIPLLLWVRVLATGMVGGPEPRAAATAD